MGSFAFPIVFLGSIMTGQLFRSGDTTHAVLSGVMTFMGILIMFASSRPRRTTL